MTQGFKDNEEELEMSALKAALQLNAYFILWGMILSYEKCAIFHLFIKINTLKIGTKWIPEIGPGERIY